MLPMRGIKVTGIYEHGDEPLESIKNKEIY
jgi:hypothetical protein